MSEEYENDFDPADAQDINKAFESLQLHTGHLKSISSFTALITLAHLLWFFLVTFAALIIVDGKPNQLFYLICVSIDAFILLSSVMNIYSFDKYTKQGNIYYQEISDAFEWASASMKRRFATRVAMKEFVVNSILPFASGNKSSISLYLLMNILLSVMTWLVMIRLRTTVF